MEKLADKLSARELEIATMVSTGKTAPQIGEALGISVGTVKKHLQSAYKTLGISGANPARQLMLKPELLKTKRK